MTKEYSDEFGIDFDPSYCYGAQDGLPMPTGGCPAAQGSYTTDSDSGNVICTYCSNILTTELFDESEVFDDDDDEEPMDEDTTFVLKGDTGVNATSASKRRNDRDNKCLELISRVSPVDPGLATYLSNYANRYEVVQKVMIYEETIDVFRKNLDILPKVLAVTLFLRDQEPTKELFQAAGIKNPKPVRNYIRTLKKLYRPYNDPKKEMDFWSLGSQMGISDMMIKAIIDEFEKLTPLPASTSRRVNTVAWLYVIAKRMGHKITQDETISLTKSGRSATISAIRKYRAFLDKLKSLTNELVEHESEETHME